MWSILVILIGIVYSQTDLLGFHRFWFDSMENAGANWTNTSTSQCIQKRNSNYCESNTNQVKACVEMRGSSTVSRRCSLEHKTWIYLRGYYDFYLTFLAVEYTGSAGLEQNDRFYVEVNCDHHGWQTLVTCPPFTNIGSGRYTESNYAKVHLPSNCLYYALIRFRNNAGSTGDKVAIDSVGLWGRRNATQAPSYRTSYYTRQPTSYHTSYYTPNPTYRTSYYTPYPTSYHTSYYTPRPTYRTSYYTPHPTSYHTSYYTPSPTRYHTSYYTPSPTRCYCPPSRQPTSYHTSYYTPRPSYHTSYYTSHYTPPPTYHTSYYTSHYTPHPTYHTSYYTSHYTSTSSNLYIHCGGTYYGSVAYSGQVNSYTLWVPSSYSGYQSINLTTCNSYTNFDTLLQASFSNFTSSECDDCGFCGRKADWAMVVNAGAYMTVRVKGYSSTTGQYKLTVGCKPTNTTPHTTSTNYWTSSSCVGEDQICGMYSYCCNSYSSCHNYRNETFSNTYPYYYGRCRAHNLTQAPCRNPGHICHIGECCSGSCMYDSRSSRYGYCSWETTSGMKAKLNSLTNDDIHPQLKKWIDSILSDDSKARLNALKHASSMINTFEEQKEMLEELKSHKKFSVQAIENDLPINFKGSSIPLIFGFQLNIAEFFALGAFIGVLLTLISFGSYTGVKRVLKSRSHDGYTPLNSYEEGVDE